jgi:iduronate 2-sulfatase
LFEESARVPLLIAAPGFAGGKTAPSPVSHVDIFPTLLELCGLASPVPLQGTSLVPMLKDPTAPGRGWALTQVGRGNARTSEFFGYSLRTNRWRYTEWDEGQKGRELYDHQTDPKEMKNLAGLAAHQATVDSLSSQLRAAVKATFPPSGVTPEAAPGLWAPVLTK